MSILDHRVFLEQDFALINPLQVGAELYADLETVRLVPEGLERHGHMMPLLVELKTLRECRRLELLMRASNWARANDMPLFSALLRGGDKNRVVLNLRRCMVVLRAGGGRGWLRYHDPRVFRHLRWLLAREQMAGLMGQVEAWTWYDPLKMRWDVYGRPEMRCGTSRLLLTQKQWTILQSFDALNRCLRELAAEGGDADDNAAQATLEGLLCASKQGLIDDDDIKLFARQYQKYGPEWHLQDKILHCLEKARTHQETYFSACVDLGLMSAAGAGSLLDSQRANKGRLG